MDYSWCVLKIAAVDENALHECGILCWKVSTPSQSALAPLNWHTDVPQRQLYGWRSRLVITKSRAPHQDWRRGRKKTPPNDLHQVNNSLNVLLEQIDRPREKISLGSTADDENKATWQRVCTSDTSRKILLIYVLSNTSQTKTHSWIKRKWITQCWGCKE